MSRTYKHQHKYILKDLGVQYYHLIYGDYINTEVYHDDIDGFFLVNNTNKYRYIKPYYATDCYANYLISKIEILRKIWGEYISKNKRNHRTKLRRVYRARLKQELIKELNYVEVDTVIVDWITDAWYQDYYMFDYCEWLRYLDRK